MLKQFKIMIGLLILTVIGYSGLWYTSAFQAEKDAVKTLNAWRDTGLKVKFGTASHGGFPYRITVTVNDLEITTRSGTNHLSMDSLTLVSHLWTPNHWLAEVTNAHGILADGTVDFTVDQLMASYRLHEDGNIIVAFEKKAAPHLTFKNLLGLHKPTLSDWSAYLRFPAADQQESSALYGARILDYDISALWPSKTGGNAYMEVDGGVIGPAFSDWTKDQLQKWAFNGGLLEVDNFSFSVKGGAATGDASMTVDDMLHLLGSASIHTKGGEAVNAYLRTSDLNNLAVLPTEGDLSIMVQNGEVMADANTVMTLKTVITP